MSRFDITSYGATPGGMVDSTAAVIAAVDACGAAGGGEVYVPEDDFLISTRSGSGGAFWCIPITWDNVQIWGPGRLICNPTAGPACLFEVFGSGKKSRVANAGDISLWYDYWLWEFGGVQNTTLYNLDSAMTFAKDSTSLTLDTASDASNFSAGDWIGIRTGETGAATHGTPDGELQEVVTSNPGTGVITVADGLKTDYAQEYFISGTSGETSTTPTANPAYFAIAKATDRLLHDVTIGPLNIRQEATQYVIMGDQTVNFREQGLDVECVGYGLESFGRSRSHTVENSTVTITDAIYQYWLTADSTCTDFDWTDIVMYSDYPTALHINEGCGRVHARNVEMHTPTIIGDFLLAGSFARGYDIDIESCWFDGGGTTAQIFIDTSSKGEGELCGWVHDCTFTDALGLSIPFDIGPDAAPLWRYEEKVPAVAEVTFAHTAGHGQ